MLGSNAIFLPMTFKWICIVVKQLHYFVVFYENQFEDQHDYYSFYMCRVLIYAADVICSMYIYIVYTYVCTYVLYVQIPTVV